MPGKPPIFSWINIESVSWPLISITSEIVDMTESKRCRDGTYLVRFAFRERKRKGLGR